MLIELLEKILRLNPQNDTAYSDRNRCTRIGSNKKNKRACYPAFFICNLSLSEIIAMNSLLVGLPRLPWIV